MGCYRLLIIIWRGLGESCIYTRKSLMIEKNYGMIIRVAL